MSNWREVLGWKLIPGLTLDERRYVLRTGRIPQAKYNELGLDLSNWGRFKHPEYGVCYIAVDVFRYIIEVQSGDDVEDYSINYNQIVREGINIFDFYAIINFAIMEGPEDTREGEDLEQLIQEEDINVIDLN